MGFSGSNRHWFVIGAEFPVGQFLVDLATEKAQPYSTRRLSSREPLTVPVGAQAIPLAIIAVAGDDDERYAEVREWLSLIVEQDIPVVLLSSAKVFAYDEVGSVETDEPTGDAALIDLETLARRQSRHLILRVNQPFSLLNKDFAVELMATARDQETLILDNLTRMAPTPADDIALVLRAMLQQISCDEGLWGTYHYCAVESTTLYAFGEVLIAEARQYEDISNVHLDEMSESDCVAQETILDSKYIMHTFGIKPRPWRVALSRLMRRYYKADQNDISGGGVS